MINLQKTPVDNICDLIIHEKIDKVMKLLMEKLQMPIPEYRRSYRLKVSLSDNERTVNLTGVDANGDCYTLFKSLNITGLGGPVVRLPRSNTQR